MKNIFELEARYDSRKSFYGKAKVVEYDDESMELISYDTIVARIDPNGALEIVDFYSPTTLRHQKEFVKQFTNFKADTKKDLMEYYI